MKTVFVTSFHQLISRNILATPILDELLSRGDLQMVLLVPINKRLFFEDNYKRKNLIIESISKDFTWRDAFLRYLALAALNTRSLAIKRRTELRGSGSYFSEIIGNRPLFRRLIRKLDRWLAPRGRFAILLDHYEPELVFSTDVQNENDVRLMHEARDRGIPVLGMVRSWDNLTSKGIMRIFPDTLLVNNDLVKEEAIRHSGMPQEKIAVVGIPHYDFYLTEPRTSRKEFFRKVGADPSKRLILFTPTGDRYLGQNTIDREVLEILRDNLPADCQILVRFPPHDTVNLGDFDPGGRIYSDRPTIPQTINPRKVELTREMDQHLADTIYHSSLVVSGPSTIAIDAALFDKPIILVGFDGRRSRPYLQSIRRYFDYEHQQPILRSGGARLAKSKEELLATIKAYLDDPGLDASGRKVIVKEQCAFTDGRSSQRVIEVLARFVSEKKMAEDFALRPVWPAVKIKKFFFVPGRNLKVVELDETVSFDFRPNCPADGSALATVATLVGNNGRQRLRIGCCPNCGFVGLKDLPTRQWYENFYRDIWDGGRTFDLGREVASRISRPTAGLDRSKSEHALALLSRVSPDRNRYLCEIGAGYGYTLAKIKEADFPKVVGLEYSRHRAAVGSQVYGLEIVAGAFENPEVQKRLRELAPISVFYSHHVLEHTFDPGEIIALASDLQREGDYFVISLPNFLGEPSFVTLFFLPEPNTFTTASLKKLLNRNGYEIVDDLSTNTYALNVIAKKASNPRPRRVEAIDYLARAENKFIRAFDLEGEKQRIRTASLFRYLRGGQRSLYRAQRWGAMHWWFQSRILGRVKRPVGLVAEPSTARFTDPAESALEIQFDGNIKMIYL